MFYAYTKRRYQVSVYRTIGPLVLFILVGFELWLLCQLICSRLIMGKVVIDIFLSQWGYFATSFREMCIEMSSVFHKNFVQIARNC